MQNLIEKLKNLSIMIFLARKRNAYEELIELDKERKIIIDKIFSKGIKKLSDENIETIKFIAEENEKLISEISIALTKKIKSSNQKLKAIQGYNY